MSEDILLEALDLLGDELKTVQRLRKMIVALAIAGKLSSRREDQSGVSFLLGLIDEKQSASQKARKPIVFPMKMGTPEDSRGVHFGAETIVRLDSIARLEKGRTAIMRALPGPFPLVVTADERATCDHFDFEGAAAIIPLVSSTGHGSASLHRLHYQEGKFALGSILAAAFPYAPEIISARFIFEYLSAFKEELLVSQMIGTANVSLTISKLSAVPIPLIASSAQQRMDALMTVCDRLDAARKERETARERFATASFARLNASESDRPVFVSEARSVLASFDALTARADLIRPLRQTIRNLAIHGRLVRQHSRDEPAAQLLERVPAGHVVGKRSAKSAATRLISGEAPFVVAKSWAWVRLGDILLSRDGERIPVSKEQRNLRAKTFDYYGASGVIDRIDDFLFDKPLLLIGEDGANLLKRSMPVAFIARGRYWVNNHAHVLDGPSETVLRYLELFINATDLTPYVTGTAQPKLNQAKMNSIPIALPPLAEQGRIVAKVDELMELCDRIEASFGAKDEAGASLLDSLIATALKRSNIADEDMGMLQLSATSA